MSDELNGDPRVPERDSGGQPGKTAEDTGRKINWDDDPEFRQWKSRFQSRIAQLDRENQQLRGALEDANMQVEHKDQQYQRLFNTVSALDPQAADTVALDARLAEYEADNQRLRQRLQQQQEQESYNDQLSQWRASEEQRARGYGLDPYDPEYQQALDRAVQTRDWTLPEQVRFRMAQANQQGQAPAERPGHSAMPPTGGSHAAPDEQEDVRAYRQAKRKLPQGDLRALSQLRAAYRGKVPYEVLYE